MYTSSLEEVCGRRKTRDVGAMGCPALQQAKSGPYQPKSVLLIARDRKQRWKGCQLAGDVFQSLEGDNYQRRKRFRFQQSESDHHRSTVVLLIFHYNTIC